MARIAASVWFLGTATWFSISQRPWLRLGRSPRFRSAPNLIFNPSAGGPGRRPTITESPAVYGTNGRLETNSSKGDLPV